MSVRHHFATLRQHLPSPDKSDRACLAFGKFLGPPTDPKRHRWRADDSPKLNELLMAILDEHQSSPQFFRIRLAITGALVRLIGREECSEEWRRRWVEWILSTADLPSLKQAGVVHRWFNQLITFVGSRDAGPTMNIPAYIEFLTMLQRSPPEIVGKYRYEIIVDCVGWRDRTQYKKLLGRLTRVPSYLDNVLADVQSPFLMIAARAIRLVSELLAELPKTVGRQILKDGVYLPRLLASLQQHQHEEITDAAAWTYQIICEMHKENVSEGMRRTLCTSLFSAIIQMQPKDAPPVLEFLIDRRKMGWRSACLLRAGLHIHRMRMWTGRQSMVIM